MNLKPISKEEFYETIGPLNVHPSVDISTLKGRYHVSYWKMQNGSEKIIGKSESDSWSIDPSQYWIVLD